jgi:hypothetical protein
MNRRNSSKGARHGGVRPELGLRADVVAVAALLCSAFSMALTPDGTDLHFRSHRFDLECNVCLSPCLLTSTKRDREACVAGEALLELKLAFNATAHRLTTWRPSDPNPCGWEGVSCSLPDLRVQSMCVLALSIPDLLHFVRLLAPSDFFLLQTVLSFF